MSLLIQQVEHVAGFSPLRRSVRRRIANTLVLPHIVPVHVQVHERHEVLRCHERSPCVYVCTNRTVSLLCDGRVDSAPDFFGERLQVISLAAPGMCVPVEGIDEEHAVAEVVREPVHAVRVQRASVVVDNDLWGGFSLFCQKAERHPWAFVGCH